MDDHHEPGRRIDGKPYKDGNTREDGSYDVGKSRPPEATRFARDDGRARGRRAKGTRNLATDWKEELAEKITISENGKSMKITKQRAVVTATVNRGLKGSERAAEIAFRHAGERDVEAGKLRISDQDIIERWMAQRLNSSSDGVVSDDAETSNADQ
ncbi:hypothetical protein ASG67_12345 [Sphingomonas sp. Leaf339]|uniref:DUF5681 domain-containing protein n=1 Tax=Sphingomonas sp. Leaf339 TaxID=1736343 RepID=UPI0006FDAC97|nr:DUF5681 domain-containing protein [Sphingomonas sp. Leaf339]KQU48126.1 hypothetical protein ASG67_12345 [Sphingomonas sp. Leaf339]